MKNLYIPPNKHSWSSCICSFTQLATLSPLRFALLQSIELRICCHLDAFAAAQRYFIEEIRRTELPNCSRMLGMQLEIRRHALYVDICNMLLFPDSISHFFRPGKPAFHDLPNGFDAAGVGAEERIRSDAEPSARSPFSRNNPSFRSDLRDALQCRRIMHDNTIGDKIVSGRDFKVIDKGRFILNFLNREDLVPEDVRKCDLLKELDGFIFSALQMHAHLLHSPHAREPVVLVEVAIAASRQAHFLLQEAFLVPDAVEKAIDSRNKVDIGILRCESALELCNFILSFPRDKSNLFKIGISECSGDDEFIAFNHPPFFRIGRAFLLLLQERDNPEPQQGILNLISESLADGAVLNLSFVDVDMAVALEEPPDEFCEDFIS